MSFFNSISGPAPVKGPLPPGKYLNDMPLPEDVVRKLEVLRQQLGWWDGFRLPPYIEELKLRYYFGGKDVAAVNTPNGLYILAWGSPRKVMEDLKKINMDEHPSVAFLCPEVWMEEDAEPIPCE